MNWSWKHIYVGAKTFVYDCNNNDKNKTKQESRLWVFSSHLSDWRTDEMRRVELKGWDLFWLCPCDGFSTVNLPFTPLRSGTEPRPQMAISEREKRTLTFGTLAAVRGRLLSRALIDLESTEASAPHEGYIITAARQKKPL